MEKIQVRQISAASAAAVMAAAGLRDPAHLHTPDSIAACGDCFALQGQGGDGVFVTEQRNDQLWVHGAGAVASRGLAKLGLGVVEAMANRLGCRSVAFQTGRPGLVRLARRQGYRITGFILEKTKA